MRPIPDQPPRRDAPPVPGIPDLYAVLDEIGASYPLLGYVADNEEEFEEETALDPAIFGGLVRP
jgi:hypothetical protein